MDMEKQNQNDLKSWEGSAISLIGDPEAKRPSFMKTITKALVAVIALQATASFASNAIPTIGHHTPGTKRGVTYEQAYELPGYHHSELGKIVQSMDKDGKTINQYFGTDNAVFVWANDTQLKEVLDQTNPNFIHGAEPASVMGKLQAIKQKVTEDYSNHFELARQNAYDGIKQPSDSESLQRLNRVKDSNNAEIVDSLYVVKSDISGQKSLDDRDHSFPRHVSKNEQVYQQFFGNISKGVNSLSSYDSDLKETFNTSAVAVADLSVAMISLKQTGNLDTWNLNLKAQRMTSIDDPLHMTSEWVDKALDGVSYDTVKNMSDKEIMQFSADRMTSVWREYDNQLDQTYNTSYVIANTHILYTSNLHSKDVLNNAARFESKYNEYHAGEKQINNADLVRNYSRSAMEASLNNMAYQGKLGQLEGEFVKAVQDHAQKFDDPAAIHALSVSTKGGHLDFKQFADQMNMKVDFDSNSRLDKNNEVMMNHLNGIVPVKVEKSGFSLSSLDGSPSNLAKEHFAQKANQSSKFERKADTLSFTV